VVLDIEGKFGCLLLAALIAGLSGAVSAQMITATDAGLGGVNLITGTILTPSGQRVDGHIPVKLRTETRGDRIAITDDSGNFGFRGLPNGDYTLVIDKEKEFEPLFQSVSVFQMPGAPAQNVYVNIRLKLKKGMEAKPGVVNSQLAGVPEAALAYHKKATELSNSGLYKDAIAQFQLAIKEYPKFAEAYSDMGAAYLKLNDIGRADDALKSALNINPTSFNALFNHGLVLFNLRRYADSEAAFREVVKAKEGNPVGHYFLGQSLAYEDKAKWLEAEKELTTALTLGGESMATQLKDAHYILGLIYREKGDKKRQISAWEAYLKLAPAAANAEQLREALKQLKGAQ